MLGKERYFHHGNPCARKHTDDGGLAQKCLY